MIHFPCTSYFDALSPILSPEEDEVIFQHPTYDIRCNQLGALYINEEKYYAVYSIHGTYIRSREDSGDLKFRDNLGMKQKIVWECYNNTHLTSGKQFYHINGNVLDFSYNNLIPTGSGDSKTMTSILSKRRRFIKASVDRLKELELKYEERGVEKQELYEVLMLPMWLINARKKDVPLRPEPKERKGKWAGKSPKTTPEEEEKIIHYFDQGLTYGEIMLRMGYRSKSPIRRVLAKWGRGRKK